MLSIIGSGGRCCDGATRRDFLTIGGLSFGAGGLSLAGLLRAEESAARTGGQEARRHKALINVFLAGGPPHQDMWDPKPEAPPEIRGPFGTISTNVPDIFVTDQLPLCAQMADKYTILRSHSHNDNGHSTGYHYVMTGHRQEVV